MPHLQFDHLRNVLKDNAAALVFFCIVLFAGASIVFNYQNEQLSVRTFIDYAEESTPFVLESINEISSLSLIQVNEQKNYEDILAKLTLLQRQVATRREDIPQVNRSDARQTTARNDLELLLEYIDSRVMYLIDRTEAVKAILPELKLIVEYKSVVESRSDEGYKRLIEAFKKVRATREGYSSSVLLYLDTGYLPQYPAIVELLAPSGIPASQPDWDALAKGSESISSPRSGFAIIRRDDVLTPEFYDRVDAAKESLDILKTAFGV